MNLISLIMPLVGGYWFLSVWYGTRFTVRRDSGYHLFFKTILFGVVFLFVAKILLIFLKDRIAICFDLQIFIPTELDLESTVAMILGVALPYVLNIFYNQAKHALIAAEGRGDLLYVTITKAIGKVELVELTMSGGKVYIGYPSSLTGFENKFVNLIPYASGFCDSETKELKLTSRYSLALDDFARRKILYKRITSFSEISINIKVKEIISARIFYPEVYAEFERIRNRERE